LAASGLKLFCVDVSNDSGKRPLVYSGNSDRTKRRRQLELKQAAVGTRDIREMFKAAACNNNHDANKVEDVSDDTSDGSYSDDDDDDEATFPDIKSAADDCWIKSKNTTDARQKIRYLVVAAYLREIAEPGKKKKVENVAKIVYERIEQLRNLKELKIEVKA
jgi:hypothetical protein